MRESSYNFSKQHSQQPKDIRGGEKKVMKKSLSTILALAMTFSMFSSVAFGADAAKSSDDFSDLKDLDAATKAKFDAMISAGIFDGVAEGRFGLKEEMNRAQFAKVAALIFGLKVDTSLKTSSFKDVKADDPANGYALPYIEAIKSAGITDGYAPGEFNPAGKVTKEQLAAFLLRGLGKDAEAKATPGVNDDTVSDWAKGYVALALQLKLLSNGADGKFGGTSNATRDLLVLGSYEAKQQYKKPFSGVYAIESFKATDVNVLTVKLNGAVTDTSAVKLDLKRNGYAVTSGYTVAWNDAKDTATLTFDNKFDESTWEITLGGLSNIDEAGKTATTTTTKEKIAKIEFLTTTDTLPLLNKNASQKIRIDFKATNQYGQVSKLTASNFTIYVSGNASQTPIGGEQAFYLKEDTANVKKDDRISITILHEDSGTQVNKIFTVGDIPFVSKVEVGDLLNSAGTKIDAIDTGSYAYLDLKAYDQYGIRVLDKEQLNQGVTVVIPDGDLQKGDDNREAFVDSAIGDDAADLKLKPAANAKAKDITVTLFANGSGQSVSKTVTIRAQKVPAALEFGSYNYNLAVGDTTGTNDPDLDAKMYVPIVVKDAQGNVLTPQEIVDQSDKLTIFTSGGITLAGTETPGVNQYHIATGGAFKGMVAIKRADSKGNATITVQLQDKPEVRTQFSTYVNEARKVDSIKFSTTPAKYQVAGAGNELKLKVYDQYGSEMKNANSNVVRLSFKNNSGDVANTYLASREKTDGTAQAFVNGAAVAGNNSNYENRRYVLAPASVGQEVYQDFFADQIFDKFFKFYSNSTAGKASYTFKATLYDTAGKEVNTLSTTVDVLDPKNDSSVKLNYQAYLPGAVDNTLLALDDFASVGDVTYAANNYLKLGKSIAVKVTTDSGDVVAGLPPVALVKSVTSSNPLVANVGYSPRPADPDKSHITSSVSAATPNVISGFPYLIGLDAGTATISVLFQDYKGNVQSSSFNVTTKNEGPSVTSIALKKSGKTVKRSVLESGVYLWDQDLAEKITVTDQYGNTIVAEGRPGSLNEQWEYNENWLVKDPTLPYANASQNANQLLNLNFYISDATGNATNKIAIDPTTGKISVIDPVTKAPTTLNAGDVNSFTVNVLAPSGKTASFNVLVDQNN
jgi:hypothetical protein